MLGLLCGNVDRYYKLYHQGMVVLPSSSATTRFHCPVCNITATCPPSDPLTSSTNHVNDDGGDKSTDPPVECPDIKLEIEQAKNQAIHRVTSTLLSQMTQKENDLKNQIGEKQRMIDGKTAGIFSAVDDLHQVCENSLFDLDFELIRNWVKWRSLSNIRRKKMIKKKGSVCVTVLH